MTKQSSVEWLVDQLTNSKDLYDEEGYASQDKIDNLVQQAKQMHKDECMKFYKDGQKSIESKFPLDAEEWYNETYGGNTK